MDSTMSDKSMSLRRRGRRSIVPCAMLGMTLIVLGGAFVRGTVAHAPSVPTSIDDGPVCQVVETREEGRHVRCSILLPFSLEEIWGAITDYENFGDICSCIQAAALVHEPDGRCRIDAQAQSG